MKIQIVDDQDQVIGVKKRTQVNYKTDIFRSSVLWLTNSKGQTLLARRAAVKDKDPGKWGPAVAGTVDEGETYNTTIYREAMEEIGLDGLQFTKGKKMLANHARKQWIQCYSVILDRDIDSFTMQADEVDALEWVDIEQMKQELQTNPDKYVPSMNQIVTELGI